MISTLGIYWPDEYDDPFWHAFLDAVIGVDTAREDTDIVISGGGVRTLVGDVFSWTADLIVSSLRSGFSVTIAAGNVTVTDGEVLYIVPPGPAPHRPVAAGAATILAGTMVGGATADTLAIGIGIRIGANVFLRGDGAGVIPGLPEVVPMTATGPVLVTDSGKFIMAILTGGTPTLDMQLPAAAAGLHFYLLAQSTTAPPGCYAVADLVTIAGTTILGRYTQSGRWASWGRVRLGGGGDIIHIAAMEAAPAVWVWVLVDGHGRMVNDGAPEEVWTWEIPENDYMRFGEVDQGDIPWIIHDLVAHESVSNAHGVLFTNTASTGDHRLTLTATQAEGSVIRAVQTHAANEIQFVWPVGVSVRMPDGTSVGGAGATRLASKARGSSATLVWHLAGQYWAVSLDGMWEDPSVPIALATAHVTLQQGYAQGPTTEITAAGGDLAVTSTGAVSRTLDLSAVTGVADGDMVEGPGGHYVRSLADDTVPGLRRSESVQSHAVDSVEGYARGNGVPNPLNPDEWACACPPPLSSRPAQYSTVPGSHIQADAVFETLLSFDIGHAQKAVVGRALLLCVTPALHVMGWEVTFGAKGDAGGTAVLTADFSVTQITNSHGDMDRDVTVVAAASGAAGAVDIQGLGVANDVWSVRLDIVEVTLIPV